MTKKTKKIISSKTIFENEMDKRVDYILSFEGFKPTSSSKEDKEKFVDMLMDKYGEKFNDINSELIVNHCIKIWGLAEESKKEEETEEETGLTPVIPEKHPLFDMTKELNKQLDEKDKHKKLQETDKQIKIDRLTDQVDEYEKEIRYLKSSTPTKTKVYCGITLFFGLVFGFIACIIMYNINY